MAYSSQAKLPRREIIHEFSIRIPAAQNGQHCVHAKWLSPGKQSLALDVRVQGSRDMKNCNILDINLATFVEG